MSSSGSPTGRGGRTDASNPRGGVIVISAALPMELGGIAGAGAFRKMRAGYINYSMGGVHGVDAALFISGMGGARAYDTALAACRALPVRAYVSIGLSAALDPALAHGDVVVGEGVREVSRGGPGGRPVASDPNLLSAAHEALDAMPGVRFGQILASDRVAVTSAEKHALAASSGCIALDMESCGAAKGAKESGVPFISIRAISDTLAEDLPADFNQFSRDGKLDWPRFALHVLTHPTVIPGLMRLGRNSRLATARLAATTVRLLAVLDRM